MKKIFLLGLGIILTILLAGYIVKNNQTNETVTEDTSVESMQQELDETQINEFDQEFKSIDEDINQL